VPQRALRDSLDAIVLERAARTSNIALDRDVSSKPA